MVNAQPTDSPCLSVTNKDVEAGKAGRTEPAGIWPEFRRARASAILVAAPFAPFAGHANQIQPFLPLHDRHSAPHWKDTRQPYQTRHLQAVAES